MISGIDHIVLTVRSLEETCFFYERVLGFKRSQDPGYPASLSFGNQKFSVHELGQEFIPRAAAATPGAADFCLTTDLPGDALEAHLRECGIDIEIGPVTRIGARGRMTSVYFRDPDANLVEIGRYDEDGQ